MKLLNKHQIINGVLKKPNDFDRLKLLLVIIQTLLIAKNETHILTFYFVYFLFVKMLRVHIVGKKYVDLALPLKRHDVKAHSLLRFATTKLIINLNFIILELKTLFTICCKWVTNLKGSSPVTM